MISVRAWRLAEVLELCTKFGGNAALTVAELINGGLYFLALMGVFFVSDRRRARNIYAIAEVGLGAF